MNTSIFYQLLVDIKSYIQSQLQLLQLQSIQQISQLVGLILALFTMTAIAIIATIFLAIALAAWLEQWLPMWASYLVIAATMFIIAFIIYGCRGLLIVRPIEKIVSNAVMQDSKPLDVQKQLLQEQTAIKREKVQSQIDAIKHNWKDLEHILQTIKSTIS